MTVTTDDLERTDAEVRVPPAIDAPRAKLVYLCLDLLGAQTVDDLQRVTNVPKLSLYSILRLLEREDVVRTDGDEYRIADA
ncbi:helix-turn-helix domain-containing protein [Halosolutus amylolyticus]|uniref:Helix-turn-helix domain-containing protein n=1 Tax=Halosolutus amylolyticus TaxID=2932267 RepID=A0ABD5PSA5_9EURY|nr:helix-turn-helix domain-containing protein [Halosolutus amylolyticus]